MIQIVDLQTDTGDSSGLHSTVYWSYTKTEEVPWILYQFSLSSATYIRPMWVCWIWYTEGKKNKISTKSQSKFECVEYIWAILHEAQFHNFE